MLDYESRNKLNNVLHSGSSIKPYAPGSVKLFNLKVPCVPSQCIPLAIECFVLIGNYLKCCNSVRIFNDGIYLIVDASIFKS